MRSLRSPCGIAGADMIQAYVIQVYVNGCSSDILRFEDFEDRLGSPETTVTLGALILNIGLQQT
jgi:hypothetical protein